MLGDEIWDEHQWEEHLRENDERMDRYMEVVNEFVEVNPRPGDDEPERLDRWKDDLREFVESKGWTEDDLPLFLLLDDEPELDDDEGWAVEIDDAIWEIEEGEEEWIDEFDDFRDLPVYEHAFDLAVDVLKWADTLPGEVKDSTLVQVCSNLMQVPAKIAKGHGLGFEKDFIGGNIACAKRSLGYANTALELWPALRAAPYLDEHTYRIFYERTYEVRNEIGVYVQELRERFDLGID